MPVEKEYCPDRRRCRTLAELFDGRSQLVVYHFMFGPGYEGGCPSCSSTADSFNGVLAHLKACDVTMICVSRARSRSCSTIGSGWVGASTGHRATRATSTSITAFRPGREDARPGPPLPRLTAPLLKLLNEQPAVREKLPLVTSRNASATGTNLDGYFSEGHGVSTFALERGAVYHCYSSYARGTEFLMGYYAILDRAPKGRDEGDQPMSWLRRHDEYEGD